tara:strand:- start:49 stop:168 length:120 start_codon:yes stop_codon:yes gene_type:complete
MLNIKSLISKSTYDDIMPMLKPDCLHRLKGVKTDATGIE